MKSKSIFVAIGLVIIAAIFVFCIKTKEITLSLGPVAKVSSNTSETILELNSVNPNPVIIEESIDRHLNVFQSGTGATTIPKLADFQRIIISQKGIHSDNGKPMVNWIHQKRYIPAQSFLVFSNKVYLGRLESTDGTTQDFYLPKR